MDVVGGLTIKRFTEYGQSYSPFAEIARRVGKMIDSDLSVMLERLLYKPVSVLELTEHQKSALGSIGVDTVGKALRSKEVDSQWVNYIGPCVPGEL